MNSKEDTKMTVNELQAQLTETAERIATLEKAVSLVYWGLGEGSQNSEPFKILCDKIAELKATQAYLKNHIEEVNLNEKVYLLPMEKNHPVVCENIDCSKAVRLRKSNMRWYITMGHCGFNTAKNNSEGYASKAVAENVYARYFITKKS